MRSVSEGTADCHHQGRWEHFFHEADVGIRGFGLSPAEAFENAGFAMTAVITDPERVESQTEIEIRCSAPDLEMLFVDWLNALIYEMSVQRMLFRKFYVELHDSGALRATVLGEPVDVVRHRPTVEIKGATYTGLKVAQQENGMWLAQCVVDV